MLKLTGKAKVRNFVGRKEFHNSEHVLAVTIVLRFEAVSIEVVKSGFIAQAELLFDANDDPALVELGPLKLSRDVNNVSAEIGEVSLKGQDITDVEVTPLAKRMCSIDLKVGGPASGVLDALHNYLGEVVKVKLLERQPELAKLEGGVAPDGQKPNGQNDERAPSPA